MFLRAIFSAALMPAIFLSSSVQADILVSDTFTYANGVLPTPPWTKASGTGGQLVANNSLAITPGTAGADDNSPTGTGDWGLAFTTPVNTGTIFAGFDLNIVTAPTDAIGNYFAHFAGTGGPSTFTTRVSLNTTGATTTLGLAYSGASAIVSDPTALNPGTTYRIVQGFNFANNTSTIWLNPVTSSSTSFSDVGTTLPTTLTGFNYRIDNATDGAKIVDNLIVATTFNEALGTATIPEPSSFALASLVSIGMCLRRRK